MRFVIDQYYIVKIQACVRRYIARGKTKYLKNEAMKKMQHETKAAIVIQQFFIKIKAEIEMEIVRMKQTKAAKKKLRCREQRTNSIQNKPAARRERILGGSGSFNITGSYNCGGQSDGFFQNGDQDFNYVRNTASSTRRIQSINAESSSGNEGTNAYNLNNNVSRIVANQNTDTNRHNVMSGGQSRSYVHREQENNMINFPSSREQPPSRKLDYPNRERNYRDDDSHAGWRTQSSKSSVSSKQMHGPYHSSSQAIHTLPPSYGNLHPYHHPSFIHHANLQTLSDAQNSQSEPTQWHISTARNATANHTSHSSSHHSVRTSHTDQHPQHNENSHPSSSSYQSATPIVRSHYADHLRLSTQSQPPSHHNDQRSSRKYHQNGRY